jgi:hypothetical protein
VAFAGGTEENNRKPLSGWPVSEPGFERGTSGIRRRNVKNSIAMSSGCYLKTLTIKQKMQLFRLFCVCFVKHCLYIEGKTQMDV